MEAKQRGGGFGFTQVKDRRLSDELGGISPMAKRGLVAINP